VRFTTCSPSSVLVGGGLGRTTLSARTIKTLPCPSVIDQLRSLSLSLFLFLPLSRLLEMRAKSRRSGSRYKGRRAGARKKTPRLFFPPSSPRSFPPPPNCTGARGQPLTRLDRQFRSQPTSPGYALPSSPLPPSPQMGRLAISPSRYSLGEIESAMRRIWRCSTLPSSPFFPHCPTSILKFRHHRLPPASTPDFFSLFLSPFHVPSIWPASRTVGTSILRNPPPFPPLLFRVAIINGEEEDKVDDRRAAPTRTQSSAFFFSLRGYRPTW